MYQEVREIKNEIIKTNREIICLRAAMAQKSVISSLEQKLDKLLYAYYKKYLHST